jgi:hypothetical protein
MYVYTVREPFAGFAKGEVLSQAQIDAYEARGGHADHHAIRLRQPAPPVLAAAKPAAKAADSVPVNPA